MGRLSVADMLSELKAREVHRVLVEGGPTTALDFLREKVVDEMILVRAAVVFKVPAALYRTFHLCLCLEPASVFADGGGHSRGRAAHDEAEYLGRRRRHLLLERHVAGDCSCVNTRCYQNLHADVTRAATRFLDS
eukprot:scaffold492_cov257-Pinguiococcus_pyrenoidosus.AAC.15